MRLGRRSAKHCHGAPPVFKLTGYTPEESSFYERLTSGFVNLAWVLFLRALANTNRVRRRQLARALGLQVRDVRAVDATQGSLPQRAAGVLPSTDSKLGGFKLTVTLSVLEDAIVSARFTTPDSTIARHSRCPTNCRASCG